MNQSDQENSQQEQERLKQQAADEVARRVEQLRKNRTRNYDDTDEDDGYHD